MSRKDEEGDGKLYFQMDRFMEQAGEWYYTTREGEERGPFESQHAAEKDLIAYLHVLKST